MVSSPKLKGKVAVDESMFGHGPEFYNTSMYSKLTYEETLEKKKRCKVWVVGFVEIKNSKNFKIYRIPD